MNDVNYDNDLNFIVMHCNVQPDTHSMNVVLLRLKRMLLRHPKAQQMLEDHLDVWEERPLGTLISVPMPTGWFVKFCITVNGIVALDVLGPSIHLRVKVIAVQPNTYRYVMVGDLLNARLVKVEAMAFSDEEIVGELMEFIYDYSDYAELEDVS